MLLDELTISSKFICVTKTDWAVCPKFAIVINDKSFDYHQSAQFLTKYYKHKSMGYISPSEGDLKWLVDDIRKYKEPMLIKEGEIYVSLRKTNRSYRIKPNNPTFNSFIARLNKVPMKLAEEEELFAVRCVLQDALFGIQMTEEEFRSDLGYEQTYESIKKGMRVYQECKNIYVDLRLGEKEIQTLLDELSSKGIE